MGFSEKPQVVDGGLDNLDGNKRWIIAGIPLRAPLKPIYTNPVEKEINESDEDDQNNCSTTSTTPTGEEARIPSRLVCPPAPRKRKATFKCNYNSGVREFLLLLTWKPFLYKGQTDHLFISSKFSLPPVLIMICFF
ncbi:unnamed protein product [Dovyalis caffra]|uniref:Uncharacterized protein n=1 Tax=Dovyalis caffra TaxID=77055 RepID=A0AAV1RED0_9ROSI|nr:unnamed protein product [Dovyalis caffra]